MKKFMIVGNWKMNFGVKESVELAKELKKLKEKDKEVVVCPSYTALQDVGKVLKGSSIHLLRSIFLWARV